MYPWLSLDMKKILNIMSNLFKVDVIMSSSKPSASQPSSTSINDESRKKRKRDEDQLTDKYNRVVLLNYCGRQEELSAEEYDGFISTAASFLDVEGPEILQGQSKKEICKQFKDKITQIDFPVLQSLCASNNKLDKKSLQEMLWISIVFAPEVPVGLERHPTESMVNKMLKRDLCNHMGLYMYNERYNTNWLKWMPYKRVREFDSTNKDDKQELFWSRYDLQNFRAEDKQERTLLPRKPRIPRMSKDQANQLWEQYPQ